MLPEIEEYFKVNEDSNEYYHGQAQITDANPVPRWSDRFTAEERTAYYAADKKRQAALLDFKHECRENKFAARDALKNHSDPMVKWLVSDRIIERDYPNYRDTVLRNLPMTREEVDSFGDQQGWCGEYAVMLQRAAKAGALPDPAPELANIDDLVGKLRAVMGGHSTRYRNIINAYLPAILESAKEKEAERVKTEAEAEKTTAETPTVDTTPADVQPRNSRTIPARNADGTFATVRNSVLVTTPDPVAIAF